MCCSRSHIRDFCSWVLIWLRGAGTAKMLKGALQYQKYLPRMQRARRGCLGGRECGFLTMYMHTMNITRWQIASTELSSTPSMLAFQRYCSQEGLPGAQQAFVSRVNVWSAAKIAGTNNCCSRTHISEISRILCGVASSVFLFGGMTSCLFT